MALTPANVLAKIVEARVGKAKLTNATTLTTLLNNGRATTQTDTECNWTVDVGGETAAWEALTADGADTDQGNTVPAKVSFGTHRLKHQFTLSKVEINKALARAARGMYQGNVDPDGIHNSPLSNLFGAEMDRAVNSIMQDLNLALWTADGSATFGNMTGLQTIIDATSYAGISGTTHPLWNAVTHDIAGAALTRDDLRKLETKIRTSETAYDMVIAHPEVAEEYDALFEAVSAHEALANRREGENQFRRADLGFGGRFYNGYQITEDTKATPERFTLMNSGDIELMFLELENGQDEAQEEQGSMGIGKHVVTDAYGFPLHIAELPSNNSAARRFEFFVIPQLKVFARRGIQQLDLTTV